MSYVGVGVGVDPAGAGVFVLDGADVLGEGVDAWAVLGEGVDAIVGAGVS
jgi:hypothetical protein